MNIQSSIAVTGMQDSIRTNFKPTGQVDQDAAIGKEFESVFLSMLVKEMRKSVEGGMFEGDKSDSLGAMFDLYMGQHMSESTPLGIGDAVSTYLERSSQS